MNITAPLRNRARERPEAIAYIRDDGTALSFRELDRAVDHAARSLRHAGIVEGDVVVPVVASHERAFVLQAALARMGAAAAAPTVSPKHATAFVVSDTAQATMHPRTFTVRDDWFDPVAAADAPPVAMHPGGDAVAIVIQSSGTTGTVKNIALSHRMFLLRHAAQATRLPLPTVLRQVCMRRPSSSYGYSARMRVLAAGGTIVHATTAEELIEATARHRVTRLSAPPFWLERIAAALPAGSRALASLEQVEVGGSFVPEPMYREACERVCATLYTNYGVTEAGFLAGGPLASLDRAAGAVGRLAPEVEVEVLDEQGRTLPPGALGTLRVRTPQAARAYFDAPEASQATFRDGWVITGDIVRLHADGNLEIAGRESEHIDVGGYKVPPHGIEAALLTLDAIVDAAAFGVPGPTGITVLAAAVVTRGEVDRDALVAAMHRHSPRFAPAFMMRVDAIPRNEAGKVLRRELVAQAIAAGLAGPAR